LSPHKDINRWDLRAGIPRGSAVKGGYRSRRPNGGVAQAHTKGSYERSKNPGHTAPKQAASDTPNATHQKAKNHFVAEKEDRPRADKPFEGKFQKGGPRQRPTEGGNQSLGLGRPSVGWQTSRLDRGMRRTKKKNTNVPRPPENEPRKNRPHRPVSGKKMGGTYLEITRQEKKQKTE